MHAFRLFFATMFLALSYAMISPTGHRVNYMSDGGTPNSRIVVDASRKIDLSWTVEGSKGGQYFYRYQMSRANNYSDEFLICDSGKVASSASLCVPACSELSESALRFTTVYWRLQLAGADGYLTPFNSGQPFVLGGGRADFSANFLAAPVKTVPTCAPVRMRAVVPPLESVTVNITYVTAFISSPGYVQVWSGGSRVDKKLAWGSWTEFTRRVHYRAFEVTDLFLEPGADVNGVPFGFRLGPGPYCDAEFAAAYNATAVPLLAEIRVHFQSGPPRVFAAGSAILPVRVHSDTIVKMDWHTGETVHNDLSAGLAGWDSLGFDDGAWDAPVPYSALEGVELTPSPLAAVGTFAHIAATRFWDLGNGTYSWAFPLNFAGYVQLTVDAVGFINSTLLLSAGEETDGRGGVVCQLLVCMTVSWRLAGDAGEVVANTFAFFGAQYFSVSGWPAGMPPPNVSSAVSFPTSTLTPQASTLTLDFGTPAAAPDALNTTLLAAVQSAVVWGQRANFQALPSDCPNREKRGWMGDGAVSAWQASTNFDVAAPYRSWTQSMLDIQARIASASPRTAGDVSAIVPPGPWTPGAAGDAAWGQAISEVTFQMLTQYGDVTWATLMYDGVRAYFRYLVSVTNSSTGLSAEATWGDWDAAFPRPFYVANTKDICATGAHVRIAQQLAFMAPFVGAGAHVPQYNAFLSAVAAPFNAAYANATAPWTYTDGVEQTPTLVALSLGLVPPAIVNHSAAWLINDVETTRALHLSTGATGTRLFFAALSALGRTDLAATVAAQSTFPSFGYWITRGATTCWENWSGETDDQHGDIPPTHNHIFLCSHSGWMWERLVGVAQAPGSLAYSNITVRPPLLADLPAMAGQLASARGRIAVAWTWAGAGALNATLSVTFPLNAVAALSVPVAGLSVPIVKVGGVPVWQNGTFVPGVVPGLLRARLDGPYVTFDADSSDQGMYDFVAEAGAPADAARAAASSSMAPTACSGAALMCPGLARIATVPRAGLANGMLSAVNAAHLQRRFLVTHVMEALCLGRKQCNVPNTTELSAILAPAVTLLDEEFSSSVCAQALCA